MKFLEIKSAFDTFVDQKIARLDNKQKAAIVIVALVLPLALFYFFVYSPKQEKISALEGKKHRLEAEIAKLQVTARKLDKHRAQMAETEKRFKIAAVLLPEQKEIPSLLTNISSLATSSGLEVLTFKPQKEKPKNFYAEIPVDIQVKGSYHKIGYFLYQLSKMPRIVSVSNVSMASPAKVAGEMQLKTSLNLVTYRFIEPKANKDKKKKKKKR
ncbi:MAG: type 4a pilus biogenesis protein PilO [Deltaproteobacteria bacterium]|jgi:type IV pilus assembly protein PilO